MAIVEKLLMRRLLTTQLMCSCQLTEADRGQAGGVQAAAGWEDCWPPPSTTHAGGYLLVLPVILHTSVR